MLPNLGYSSTNRLHVFLAIALLLLLVVNGFDSVAYGVPADACLFITPSMRVPKEIGELFDIAINISNVEDLRSLEFTVTYNTSLLDVTQVIQGPFFPSPPDVRLEFERNESLGFVMVNMSLLDSEAPRSGNGTLAWISFKVVQGPESCVSSPLDLEQTLLLNSALNPIAHDLVGAVYFWHSMLPDPPPGGRLLDVYTPKGGEGPNEPGGEFVAGEMMYLVSRVTYNDYPVQQKSVAFEVQSPLGETVVMLVAVTDQDGFARISFRIPNIPSSNKTWAGISVVDIAGETVWDTINFRVYLSLSVSISPLSASILVGQSVTFTSTVSGGQPPYNYQWYLDGSPVSGAISSTWVFTPIANGIYYVYLRVTDSEGNIGQSETARIVVAAVSVGGYSVSFEKHPLARPLTLDLALAIGLALFFVAFRRKTTRKD